MSSYSFAGTHDALLVGASTVLRPARRCTVRKEVSQFLLYNADTDEMHLVPAAGMFAYWHCDGSRPAEEVATLVADAFALPPEAVTEPVYTLLDRMVSRRLLDVVGPWPDRPLSYA